MSLLRIPKGLFKFLIFLVLLTIGAAFAMVKTQAGRDVLGIQIEAAFSNAFEGSLEIGRLRGNVLATLYAIDVTLRDPDGRIVVHVDSIVAGLSIFDALRQNITIRTAEFIRPKVSAVRDDSGKWNLADVFRAKSRASEGRSQWKLKSADVQVRGGRIQAINSGSKPSIVESGHFFDYANTHYEDVHGRLTVDWGEADRLIDVINLGGRAVDPGFLIEEFNGQLIASESTATLSAVRLRTASSIIELSAALSGFDGFNDLVSGASKETRILVRLDAVKIDSAEVALLFPSVHVPDLSFSVELEGARSDLSINQFGLQIGTNQATGFGSVRGLPDLAEFRISVDNSSIDPTQLARLVAGVDSDIIRRTPQQRLTAEASGTISRGVSGALANIQAALSFQAESRLGVVDGKVNLHRAEMDTTSYDATVDLFDFRIGQLLPQIGSNSVWNGQARVTGFGTDPDALEIESDLTLYQSSIRGLLFDNLEASADASGRSVRFALSAGGPDGSLRFDSDLDFSNAEARVNVNGGMDRLDLLRAIGGPEPDRRTEFTLRTRLTASGSSVDDLTGSAVIAMDTVSFFSTIDTVGLPASEHRLELSHRSERETSLRLLGDVFEGEFEGLYTFRPLARVVSLWLGAASRTVRAQTEKKLHPEDFLPENVGTRDEHIAERDSVIRFLGDHGFMDGLHFTGSLRVNRLIEFNRLVQALPIHAANVSIRTAGRIAPDGIDLQVWLDADSLRGASADFDGVRGQISVSGAYDNVLEDLVDSDITLEATRIGLGRDKISDLGVVFRYADRAGSLTIESRNDDIDSLSVGFEASLAVLDDRNEVVVSDAFLRRIGYEWRVGPDAVFDLYGDAIRIEGFNMLNRNTRDADGPPQQVALNGTLSGNFADTLNVRAQHLSMDQVSDLLDFRDHIGGDLSGTIAVAHALRRPEVVGGVTVQELSYVGRDVGDLKVSSSYSRQGESLFVDVEISQPRTEGALVKGNHARVSGTIAIPGPDSEVPFGALDVSLNAKEVDLFFFDILFPTELQDVSGKATGTGTISGVLTKPIFDADVQVLESDFVSPAFNLRFGLSGRVTIDSLGFHFHEASLTDPTGGRGTLRGHLLFNDYRFFSFDIEADIEELMIMNVTRSEELAFYGQVWVTGSATLTGPLQRTLMRSTNIVTSDKSRLFLPVTDDEIESDQTYIVFADSSGTFEIKRRRTMLDARPRNERSFVDGMDMNFNITIPNESNVFLVFDALLGDMIQARGSGRVQFQRFEGEYAAFGTLTVSSGDYLFTAGEVFQRRFILDPGGTITWDGDPVDAALAIPATYRARASLAGLPGQNSDNRVPIRVNMNLSGRLSSPAVGLRIALDVDQRDGAVIPPGLESAFNREDLAAEYATSVLLTNTFLLTSSSEADPTSSADDLLFNSLSHLISSQLNRFVSEALDLDVNVGVQQGRTDNAYDLVYGFALRLDDQGLVIRGEGLYETTTSASSSDGLQGEFVVEYRLTPAVRLELFFRRESDLYRAASTLGTSYGAGIVYQTDFANWKSFGRKTVTVVEAE
jgi:translocation and assembly module TamB